MAHPEELLAVLARAANCQALTLLEHGTHRGYLRRTSWKLRQPRSRSSEPADLNHFLITLLWSSPLMRLEQRGREVLIAVRRTDTAAFGWELTPTTVFDSADVTMIATLLPLFALAESAIREGMDAHGLTRRETDILRLISEGLTATAAARRCGISSRTVHKHLEHAYRKIGCHDRVSAVQFLRRAGLLTAIRPES
jgi:DNA-binding CsgD family transcriptional regulator